MSVSGFNSNYNEIIKYRRFMQRDVKAKIFEQRVSLLNENDTFRTLFKSVILFREDGSLTDEQLKPLREKLISIMSEANQKNEIIDGPDYNNYSILNAGKAGKNVDGYDRTLFEIGNILSKGQIERFVNDKLSVDAVDANIHRMNNPEKYAKGFIQKITLAVTAPILKKINKGDYFESFIDTVAMNWKDDMGVDEKHNPYLNFKKIKEKRTQDNKKSDNKIKVEL